ncbi:hypothetical protein Salat_1191900 [Sesamum alatum]|uniref:Retrotransposon gag domain-containing protein n=1 Tax=Sesamum alatum TaxID=300844 RepID=A0AAE1YEZ0_9LAMI|nr:hypothetical protein Salat_1191900 [Sesamum alatum]
MEQMIKNSREQSSLGDKPVAVHEGSHSTPVDSDSSGTPSRLPSLSNIELPRFNWDEPGGWIRKCQWYFQVVYTIPEDQGVSLASIYLDGRAELWFQRLIKGKELPNWQQFIEAVYERFEGVDPSAILGEFNTLQQGKHTVDQYFEHYEELKSHMMIFHSDFSEGYFVTCFINGLRSDIKGAVILRPNRLHQALALAKNQEQTVGAILQLVNSNSKTWPIHSPKHYTTPKPSRINPTTTKTYRPLPKPIPKKHTPIRKILNLKVFRQTEGLNTRSF